MKLLKFSGITCLIFLVFNSLIYADEPLAKDGKDCHDYESSYGAYVFKARNMIQNGKTKKGIELLKKHLECWNDEEVSLELAAIYESQKRYYLAGVIFKEAGMMDLYDRVEQLRIANNTEGKVSSIRNSALKQSMDFQKSYKSKKNTAIALAVAGSVIAGTGFGLFLHDKAFGGTNSPTAQFTLMFTGLSMIGAGVALNLSSDCDKNSYHTFMDLSKKQFDLNSILDDDYIIPQTENTIKLNSVQAMKRHGTTLILLSLPMLALSIFAIHETVGYVLNNDSIFKFNDEGGEILYYIFRLFYVPGFAAVVTLFPTMLCLVAGIKTLVKASKWENLKKDPELFTLDSIAPMINPVSKTYGVAMRFSF